MSAPVDRAGGATPGYVAGDLNQRRRGGTMSSKRAVPIKCLLVDDLDENLIALSALLEQDDVEVHTVRSGSAALELLLLHDFALAFIDVQMPDMDGFELAELMRGAERTRRVPLIFVTAGPRERQRLFKGYETGAVDFIYKPIEPHIIRNKAEVFFELYRQRQQLAQELKDRTETLRLNEMFSALLAHDLRNPLSAVLASAQLLERRATEPAIREPAAHILACGRRMGRLIEDMLDLSRARLGGGIALKPESADFRQLVERVLREHRVTSPDRRIETRFDGDTSGRWDCERIAQVASNLIGNALKHGDAAAPVVVAVDGTQRDQVAFSVANRGVIPPELREHLFDPFRGAERSGGRREGLGLGLYIVDQIVRAHRGRVEVESGADDRTVFRVAVPRAA